MEKELLRNLIAYPSCTTTYQNYFSFISIFFEDAHQTFLKIVMKVITMTSLNMKLGFLIE